MADAATADGKGSPDPTADAAAAATAAAEKATADAAALVAAEADKVSKDAEAKVVADAAAAKALADAAAARKAPDKYELKLAEGSLVDQEEVTLLEQLARSANMPNDEAQGYLEAQNAMMVERSIAYETVLRADKEYGGDKLAETQELANALIDRLRPEGHRFREATKRLLARGEGNNIVVASLLADLGRMTKEDGQLDASTGGGGRKKTIEQTLYPNAKS